MKSWHIPACLIAATLAGCEPAGPGAIPKAPHGGSFANLPEGLGRVEIVREEVAGQQDQARLVLYFSDPEGKPMQPAPAYAILKPRERGAAPVDFKPTGDTDPARAGGLASSPFRARSDITGELTTSIGGKPASVLINVR